MDTARTDLALEAHESLAAAGEDMEGVTYSEQRGDGYDVKRVIVQNGRGAERIGKPAGTYVTIEAPGLRRDSASLYRKVSGAITGELSKMLSLSPGDAVMVIGLGNRRITPDALGPRTADKVLATRHLVTDGELGGAFRSVCVLSLGVLGLTGIDTTELTRVLTGAIKPALVVVVDALAARSAGRLASTFQLSDTGVAPGSGVGGTAREISRASLGVSVISIGVPTVMDASAVMRGDDGGENASGLFVTPNNIDVLIEAASSMIALGLNCALHPALSPDEIESLMSN
ncbi:MAG: GPR endopeptidase [Clostridia bacterium]|nr:GPR endopeptidase [Clostridia bacterium]